VCFSDVRHVEHFVEHIVVEMQHAGKTLGYEAA